MNVKRHKRRSYVWVVFLRSKSWSKGSTMKKKIRYILIFIAIVSLALAFVIGPSGESHSLKEAMKEAVIHETEKISVFGMAVNPSVMSAFVVSGFLVLIAIFIRMFVIPKFTRVPGKVQLLLESLVSTFKNLAIANSPHNYFMLAPYIFTAGIYIAISTLFELVGMQYLSINGNSLTLPAPLSDLSAAIAMGGMSFLFIMSGGIMSNGFKGILKTLKEFSLPISMSFRLFGALVSGLLVMDLVYHSLILSIGLPVIVAVLFTLLHAFIQAYVLTLLVSIYYGEVSEKEHAHEA